MNHVLRFTGAQPGADANVWTFDEMDARVLAAIRVANSSLVLVAIRVASPRRRSRERHEFALWPASDVGNTWCLERGVYDAHLGPPHPILPAMALILTDATPRLARELRRLSV